MGFGDCLPVLRHFATLYGGEKPNARLSIVLAFRGFLFLAVIHALPFEESTVVSAPGCRCLHFAGKGQVVAGGRDGAKGPLRSWGQEASGRAPAVLSFPTALSEQASFGKSF